VRRNAPARFALSAAALTLLLVIPGSAAHDQTASQALPNMGQQITPLAPQGSRFEPLNPDLADKPDWLAGQAVTTAVSPDHKTLLILTSGFNRVWTDANKLNAADSAEYVFVYDISTSLPVKKQVIRIANTYNGMVFDPSGTAFYVAGGSDDNIHIVTRDSSGTWGEQRLLNPPLALDHHGLGNGLAGQSDVGTGSINLQVGVKPCAAGLAISNDGKTLVVANYYNDSITVFNKTFDAWWKVTELDLRPGKSNTADAGVPGGNYPFWVAIKGNGSSATAYVSSVRDREVVVVDLGGAPAVTARIRVAGQPNKMTLNAAQSLLFVVEDQADTVDVIDTRTNTILETIPVIAPRSVIPAWLASYTGANPNSVTLSPDETQLYVTNGNLNCLAVVSLNGTARGAEVVGLIPTGWYPNSVSFSGDGQTVYVVNGKSPTGPNPDWCYNYGPASYPLCKSANAYNPQLTKAGFQSFPRPNAAQLARLTTQVATNNRFSHTESAADAAVMAAVRRGVRHVIFVIKENRTYDQVLGDLEVGNGDPRLAEFGEAMTPNQHNLARQFVTLDNFYATAEVSNDGWPWSTSARAPDVVERQFAVAYAGRGLSLDSEGLNRSVNIAYPTLGERRAANPLMPSDPDLLPGQTNVSAPDGPDHEINAGYLWDSALRAHLTVRNYGFFVDTTRYVLPATSGYNIPLVRNPAATGTIVAYPANAALAPYTDYFFRGFDNAFPDYYRYTEWAREFDADYSLPASTGDGVSSPNAAAQHARGLPALSLVRFMHDHTGDFDAAIDGVNTPETQQADNDYAVGLLVQKIAHSKYANNTLIFVIEDDAQDGPDHVDSHRSIVFVAGAYVKQGALVSTQYNTINLVRTIEEVLGLPPMNLNDALAKPMADIFNTRPGRWDFTATPSAYLYGTQLPLPAATASLVVPKPAHDAAYWAQVSKGMNFAVEDQFDFAVYNRILWEGIMRDGDYPAAPTGLDLRQDRKALLARYRQLPR
jgi:DNA-binding beta-propeller fold protein YncE